MFFLDLGLFKRTSGRRIKPVIVSYRDGPRDKHIEMAHALGSGQSLKILAGKQLGRMGTLPVSYGLGE